MRVKEAIEKLQLAAETYGEDTVLADEREYPLALGVLHVTTREGFKYLYLWTEEDYEEVSNVVS